MLNFIHKNIRAAAILTTSYVAATVLDQVGGYNQLALYIYYTKGSLTSLEIKVESSVDSTNYVPETNMTISAGTITLNEGSFTTTEDGNIKIVMPMSANFVKVSAKGTGTATNSSLAIDAFLHTV